MGSLARNLRPALASLVFAAVLVLPARANEVAARSLASGVRIHGPEEVLRDFCGREDDGTIWMKVPGGASWELVASTADPAIANPGDGAFHPFVEAEVREALAEIRYPLESLDVDIYLLPFPRRGALDSGAGPGLILLSPGVVPIARAQQHAELAHELGHVVQYQWMPDGDGRWSQYRSLRGLQNTSLFAATSVHANRPHEIFAEDFRALYGGSLATYSGSIENATLAPPAAVPGLDAFLRSLPAGTPVATRLLAGANPARGPVTFALAEPSDAAIDLFDVSGRRIATIAPVAAGAQTTWRWDGRTASGAPVASGMLIARVRGRQGASLRISWLP